MGTITKILRETRDSLGKACIFAKYVQQPDDDDLRILQEIQDSVTVLRDMAQRQKKAASG